MKTSKLHNYRKCIKKLLDSNIVQCNKYAQTLLSNDLYIDWFLNVWEDRLYYYDLYVLAVELGYDIGKDKFLHDVAYFNVFDFDPVYAIEEFLSLLKPDALRVQVVND